MAEIKLTLTPMPEAGCLLNKWLAEVAEVAEDIARQVDRQLQAAVTQAFGRLLKRVQSDPRYLDDKLEVLADLFVAYLRDVDETPFHPTRIFRQQQR